MMGKRGKEDDRVGEWEIDALSCLGADEGLDCVNGG